jgi:hypothetical protein
MADTLSGQKSLDGIQGGRRPDTQGYTRTRAQVCEGENRKEQQEGETGYKCILSSPVLL